jgi:hypothetical protein
MDKGAVVKNQKRYGWWENSCRKAIAAFRRILRYRAKSFKPVPGGRTPRFQMSQPHVLTCAIAPSDTDLSPPVVNDNLLSLVNTGITITTRVEMRTGIDPSGPVAEYLIHMRKCRHESYYSHNHPFIGRCRPGLSS